jgi:hypothetical protein
MYYEALFNDRRKLRFTNRLFDLLGDDSISDIEWRLYGKFDGLYATGFKLWYRNGRPFPVEIDSYDGGVMVSIDMGARKRYKTPEELADSIKAIYERKVIKNADERTGFISHGAALA